MFSMLSFGQVRVGHRYKFDLLFYFCGYFSLRSFRKVLLNRHLHYFLLILIRQKSKFRLKLCPFATKSRMAHPKMAKS